MPPQTALQQAGQNYENKNGIETINFNDFSQVIGMSPNEVRKNLSKYEVKQGFIVQDIPHIQGLRGIVTEIKATLHLEGLKEEPLIDRRFSQPINEGSLNYLFVRTK